jgi:sugar O-acyltransferase (sialic acid O-acetyltransferase NeuD family)
MKEIILLGGGGHCKSVIDVIEQEKRFRVAGIIDIPERFGISVLNYKVIASDNELKSLNQEFKYAVVTVGQIQSPELRIKLFDLARKAGFILPAIISPRAYVSHYASIDEGTVICHDVLLNSNAKIGKNCIINSKALIEHDVSVKDNCHISTGVIINGGVTIEKDCFIGSNSTIRDNITVNERSFIKAGSMVK